ncbi:hypothetical protein F0562_021164 [Nyssa sinensis]|uniref:Cytochrome P450 n=1 Tax=Nyssa sinensis TaxID=561372 RepID=A0A5J5BQ80_9ASTE|nr:hypothetical protein F0562_021164 [Nyssa sinensis]
MFGLQLSTSLFLCFLPLIFFFFIKSKCFANQSSSKLGKLPRSYPLVGSYFAIFANRNRRIQWTSDIVRSSPSSTFVLHRGLGHRQVYTANPSNVQHILKTNFNHYGKGDVFRATLSDLLGDGIFNSDGQNWKFQRQVASHEFNTKSLRKFIETVVDTEVSDRLLPILFRRRRKQNRSEKRLRVAVNEVREFAKQIIKEKIEELNEKSSLESVDLLSRFLSSGHSDENFVTDIVISFILAGRDTTSAALTWYFWLVSGNPAVEDEILREIREKSEAPVYDEVKGHGLYTRIAVREHETLPAGPLRHQRSCGRQRIARWDCCEERYEGDLPSLCNGESGEAVGVGLGGVPPGKMKSIASSVLRRFRVVPAVQDGVEPVFIAYLSSKMKGGFPVRIEERAENL